VSHRTLPAAILAILLVTSPGPLLAVADARPPARVALMTKHRHRHGAARRHHRSHTVARPRHRTRGYRGIHPVGRSNSALAAHGTKPAAIAAVLAITCQNTELTPGAANVDLVRAAVLCLINRERAQNGEAPLAFNAQLQQAAEGYSHELVSGDFFQHVSPSGQTPVDRARAGGYMPTPDVGYVIGENLAWGTLSLATPQAIVNAWLASPGHLANILEAQYTETGIGVTPQVPPSLSGGSAGATYAQEFGVIIH
jgi:uncharacterized protein YkwD